MLATDPSTLTAEADAALFATLPRRRLGITFWLAVAWLSIVILGAIFADVLPLRSPSAVAPFAQLKGIGAPGHLLGTDDLGRDVLARMVFGSRVSLIVAVSSVVVGAGIGLPVGMAAGYLRGRFDAVVVFIVDVILSFPALVLLLALVTFLGQSLVIISLTLGFLAIPAYTRLARANTLATASRTFVQAARAVGESTGRIIFHELLPNVAAPVMAYSFVSMGLFIVIEGSLSFLGLSVEAPVPSWGGMIASGSNYLLQDPQLVLLPALAMLLTVLSLNLIGDGIRHLQDVREARA
jgi:peptide/nickel transport system permease protein